MMQLKAPVGFFLTQAMKRRGKPPPVPAEEGEGRETSTGIIEKAKPAAPISVREALNSPMLDAASWCIHKNKARRRSQANRPGMNKLTAAGQERLR